MSYAVQALVLVLVSSLHWNTAQTLGDEPTNVRATPMGARAMLVLWDHTGDFGLTPSGTFMVSLRTTSEGSMMQTTLPGGARSYLATGLSPYRYNTSTGVSYRVGVRAISADSVLIGNEVEFNTVLPRCPGMCNYQYETDSGTCSPPLATCVCSSAYSGDTCSEPLYQPTITRVDFQIVSDADIPQMLTVEWFDPASTTLDGRVIVTYTVRVAILQPSGSSSVILSRDYAPNNNGRYTETIADASVASTYSLYNYAVTVETVTDVARDVAVAGPINVTTHVPGPVMNLTVTALSPTTLRVNWDPFADSDLLTQLQLNAAEEVQVLAPIATVFIISGLTPGTAYSISVRASNVFGEGQFTTATGTTLPTMCAAGLYGLSTATVCTDCPINAVSDPGSRTIADCQCPPGFTPIPSTVNGGCNPCTQQSYKSTLGSSLCAICPILTTTASNASTSATDCICRYSDNSSTCYYFATSLPPVTLTNLPAASGVSFRVSWDPVPQSVVSQDMYNTTSNPLTYTTSAARIRCNSTGRGLVTAGYTYDTSVDATNTSAVFQDSGLRGLVEYACNGSLVAVVNNEKMAGPPSDAVTLVTLSTADTNSALPIFNVTADSNTVIAVSYSIDPDLIPLITHFLLIYDEPIRTFSLPLPPPSQGVQRLPVLGGLDRPLVLYFNTTVGDTVYQSAVFNRTLEVPFTLPAPTVDDIGGQSARVSWSPVASANGYVIYIQSAGGETRTERATGGSVTEYVVEGLMPHTEYTVQVAAIHSDGTEGQRSAPFTLVTLEALPGPPHNVQVLELSGGTINVIWERPNAPNGIITGYVVTVTSASEQKNSSYDSSTFSAMFSQPSSPYTASVQAVNSVGVGQKADATVVNKDILFTIIIPAAGGGGGAIIFCCLLLIIIACCCCCCRSRGKKGRGDLLVTTSSNSYIQATSIDKRLPIDIPMHKDIERGNAPPIPQVTYSNPGNVADEYINPVSSFAPVAAGGQLLTQQEEYTPMAAGGQLLVQEEQYAEIPASGMHRLRSQPSLIEVVVKKDATPADYNNEELYMEMEKIYFADAGKANTLAGYEIDRADLDLTEEIGHGEYGRVMKATANNIFPGQATSIVAVKMLKDDADERMKKNFLGEAELLAKFGSHPNVMGLLRVVCQSMPQLVIIWYMPHGDLKKYLRKSKKSEEPLGTAEQLHISEQVAAGMEYLAKKFFIHRDLAARNVLVGKNNSVKISDFGLSRALAKDDSYYKLSQNMKLPVKWMALECLLYQKFSTYSDVWSYGVLLWEVFTFGESPYKGIKGMEISAYVQKGNRLPCPEGCCPQPVYQMMLDCWKTAKEERPTFIQLQLKLKAQSIVLNRRSASKSDLQKIDEHSL